MGFFATLASLPVLALALIVVFIGMITAAKNKAMGYALVAFGFFIGGATLLRRAR